MTRQNPERFKRYFDREPIMLLDGATGTQLMLMGLKPGECAELWNVRKPDQIKNLAKMYFDSGSDAVLTNTFGALSFALRKHGLEEFVYELNRSGAANAVSVCPEGKFVLGCIGITGGYLKPYGDLTEEEVIDAYSEQVRGLVDGGVDAFSLETFADLNEMKCAIKAVKNSGLPYLCSMTFEKKPRGYFTTSGVTILQAVETLFREGAFAVGSNCGNGIENMIGIVGEIREISDTLRQISTIPDDLKIICEPNAGNPKQVDGKDRYEETPEFFRTHLPELLRYKPSILGGCCGTTPEHIRVMRESLKSDRTI